MSGHPVWAVLPGCLDIASADGLPDVPYVPATVLCLRRRPPHTSDYPAAWNSTAIQHLPLTYWTDDALPRLHQAVHLALACPGPVLAHCALGLDRCGLLALAVHVYRGASLAGALSHYRARGVRLPEAQAMNLLSHYYRTLREPR
jgi:hypothetical protein